VITGKYAGLSALRQKFRAISMRVERARLHQGPQSYLGFNVYVNVRIMHKTKHSLFLYKTPFSLNIELEVSFTRELTMLGIQRQYIYILLLFQRRRRNALPLLQRRNATRQNFSRRSKLNTQILFRSRYVKSRKLAKSGLDNLHHAKPKL